MYICFKKWNFQFKWFERYLVIAVTKWLCLLHSILRSVKQFLNLMLIGGSGIISVRLKFDFTLYFYLVLFVPAYYRFSPFSFNSSFLFPFIRSLNQKREGVGGRFICRTAYVCFKLWFSLVLLRKDFCLQLEREFFCLFPRFPWLFPFFLLFSLIINHKLFLCLNAYVIDNFNIIMVKKHI